MSRRLFATLAAWLVCSIPLGVAVAGDISVSDPFARASAGMAKVGAAFMTLQNAGGDDKLVSAASPVADHVELHAHVKDGDVMRMRQIESIDVPAGGSVQLAPGGVHLMLIDLKEPLKQGQSFPLTLTFAKAGAMTIEVPIKAPAEMAPMPMPGHQH
jgi:periplasmic copper chaperone A